MNRFLIVNPTCIVLLARDPSGRVFTYTAGQRPERPQRPRGPPDSCCSASNPGSAGSSWMTIDSHETGFGSVPLTNTRLLKSFRKIRSRRTSAIGTSLESNHISRSSRSVSRQSVHAPWSHFRERQDEGRVVTGRITCSVLCLRGVIWNPPRLGPWPLLRTASPAVAANP